ncbi:type IV pilus biogenesis protein PilM [Virgibacillus sp. W0181]|uniref:type IV pilus biogenesis protein PilM n=1 Tax=Virgibacillus sp. W0181 TaxID=3391581 RepID=UPI003F48A5F4
MILPTAGRVNLVITNNIIRYSFHKQPSMDGLAYKGELELPQGTVQDGVILNKAVFKEAMNKLVVKHKWKRKKLFLALPDSTVVIRELKIPAALEKEEAIGYIKNQLGSTIYLPFDQPALAVEFLEVKQEEREILLFAYPKEKITGFTTAFEEVGLKPVVADLTFLSIYRYFAHNIAELPAHLLLIHWNEDALVLTAFQHNKAIFTRYIKPDQAVNAQVLEQPIQDNMIEIRRILDFYQYSIMNGDAAVEQILLTGDSPYLQVIKKSLNEEFALDIYAPPISDEECKYVDVYGLGLKQDA